MKLFQQTLIPDPLGVILSRARKKKRLAIADAARIAGISEAEAEALEADRIISPGTARLHALSYARSLGINPSEIRESLPPAPGLRTAAGGYLSEMAHPRGNRTGNPPALLRGFLGALAPLGRLVLYLFLTAILLGAWGMTRQLSRIRSIPWVTSNSRPPVFHDR